MNRTLVDGSSDQIDEKITELNSFAYIVTVTLYRDNYDVKGKVRAEKKSRGGKT